MQCSHFFNQSVPVRQSQPGLPKIGLVLLSRDQNSSPHESPILKKLSICNYEYRNIFIVPKYLFSWPPREYVFTLMLAQHEYCFLWPQPKFLPLQVCHKCLSMTGKRVQKLKCIIATLLVASLFVSAQVRIIEQEKKEAKVPKSINSRCKRQFVNMTKYVFFSCFWINNNWLKTTQTFFYILQSNFSVNLSWHSENKVATMRWKIKLVITWR